MLLPAYFSESGASKPGLAPVIEVIDLSGASLVVSGATMTDMGKGFYSYNFTTYDHTKAYSYICDSVTLTGIEQYATESVPSMDAIADAVADEVYEGTLTHREITKIILAALAGKSSGGGTFTNTFKDISGTTNRITATVTSVGNRSGVSLDGS